MGTVLLDAGDMRRTLGRLAHEILEANGGADNLVVIGILRRGWPVAKRLAFLMTQIEGTTVPCGKLDISRYRDDRRDPEAEDGTEIPFAVEGKKVILVDEVVYTGRTVRAALEAVITHGRPERVQFAALVDRGHREFPIQPDYCGKTVHTRRGDHIAVRLKDYEGEDEVVLIEGEEEVVA